MVVSPKVLQTNAEKRYKSAREEGDQVEDISLVKSKGKRRKTIGQTIQKGFKFKWSIIRHEDIIMLIDPCSQSHLVQKRLLLL